MSAPPLTTQSLPPGTLPVDFFELMKPTDKQRVAMRAVLAHTYTLYGGAAGGGKSYFLRWMLLYLLLRWARQGKRGVEVAIFCETYKTLNDRQLRKISREFPTWLGTFKKADGEFRLHERFGGGAILFRNLDDPGKYQSAEFAAIGVDELTKNPKDVFDDLRFRLRWTGISDARFIGATNPGSVGHYWCKAFWIDGDFTDDPNLADQRGQFAYVKALVYDNPHVDPSYVKLLESLPADKRRAFLEGDWDIFGGQMFGEWRRSIHVIPAFQIPSWWTRWMGNDPGFKDPSCWGWYAVDQSGYAYRYRERTFTEVTAYEQARQIAEINKKNGENISYIVTGMDAFVVKDRAVGKRDVDYYEQGGLRGFRQPVHGPGARAARAKTVHEYLAPFSIKPDPSSPAILVAKVRVFDCCEKLISTLPALPQDDLDPEAVKECDIDHWYDEFGYALQSWHADKTKYPHGKSYLPGSAGDVLKHAEVLAPEKPKGPFARARG